MDQALALCVNLRPGQNLIRLPQTSRPEWVLLDQLIGGIFVFSLDNPDSTSALAIRGVKRPGCVDLIRMVFKKCKVSWHFFLADIGVGRPARNLSTTLRHRRFLFTDSFLLLWKWRVG